MSTETACNCALPHAEKELAALRKLLNSSLDVICSFDSKGCFLFASEAATELWGYSPEELQGRFFESLVHPDDLEKTREAGRDLQAGKKMTHFENRYVRKDGTVVPLVWSARYDEADGVLYCVARDASEKKELEQRFAKTQRMFESFMDNSPLGSWIADEHGVMHFMNRYLRAEYGFAKGDVGKSLYELLPEQVAVDYHIANLQVIREGRVTESLETAILPSGKEKIVKIYKFPLQIEGTNMVGGWAVDLSEQLELQRQLEKSVERYHYVNEATSDAIYDWNIAKNTIYKGPGFETLFGYPKAPSTLRFRLSRIHPDDLPHYKHVVFSALRHGSEKWTVAFRFKDAKDRYRNVVEKAFVIYENAKACRVIGALQDVTEQKLLEKKLVEAERKIKQQVVKSIIDTQEKERRSLSIELHDNVNQMLASCKLMLEFAKENSEAAPMLTEKTYQSLQTVINEIRRISHSLNPSVIEDLGLVEAIAQMVENVNLSKKLTVHFDAAVCPSIKFNEADKIAVYRIVQEQLNNILKHAGAKNVYITLVHRDRQVHLSVEDDGVGFDPLKCKKGLGLKNINHRVEYYNGQVKLTADEGKGCRLDVQLTFP